MCEFFNCIIKRHKQKEYINGYNWAAGVLLRGELTEKEVRLITFGDHSHTFDRGALDAVVAINHLCSKSSS